MKYLGLGRNFLGPVLFVCLICFIGAGPAQAEFVIRQESIRSNGVLTSGPNILDRELAFFLSRNAIHTLEHYVDWLKSSIDYRPDFEGDSWASPIQTLKRRYGDCEDLAFLTAAVLRVLGLQPKVFILIKKGQAHAVCETG